YASNTGNTEKIARELENNFEKYGWSNELKKIPKDYDVKNPDFEFDSYDFVCVGSPVIKELPVKQIRRLTYGNPGPRKLTIGEKCGIVFCTYGGIHLGPKEAEPALKILELELMHQRFNVIGSLAIPGKICDTATDEIFFADLHKRPDDNDIKNVALFVDGIMSKLREFPHYNQNDKV
ncbi:MAG: hypothetical protein JXB42_03290, partial [Deltaproteobacteria bacterium]|nr:hypothetical protein [Deltaproteobacteria bacterium]